jgi:hypothetical protein
VNTLRNLLDNILWWSIFRESLVVRKYGENFKCEGRPGWEQAWTDGDVVLGMLRT